MLWEYAGTHCGDREGGEGVGWEIGNWELVTSYELRVTSYSIAL